MTAFQMFKSAKVKRLEEVNESLFRSIEFWQNGYARAVKRFDEKHDEVLALKANYKEAHDDCIRLDRELTEMTECRDTLQAVIAELNKEMAEKSRVIRELYVHQDINTPLAVLKVIAAYGTYNPTWAVKLAKAAVEGEG